MERQLTLVYAGKGSSHSWTWLADLFESRGILNVRFVDSQGFSENLSAEVAHVMISGGDGFQIAESFGKHGFAHLKGYLHQGGTYIGICAGAYLPLPSSIEPFNQFNLSSTKVQNTSMDELSEDTSPRIAVRYGSCAIVHPVRGEVELKAEDKVLRAPLYGGPVFSEPDMDDVLMRYHGFTEGTELQLEKTRTESMMLGKPAAIKSRHGKGTLLLFGPHLEHPRYPEANDAFIKFPSRPFIVTREERPEKGTHGIDDENLAKAIADLKVAILGLENRSFMVGNKLWDGSRFLELANAIERRAWTLGGYTAERVTSGLQHTRDMLVEAKPETIAYADQGPGQLVEAARICVDNHFRVLREKR